MAKVFFGPYAAIKYVGRKKKVLATSRARPKPELLLGDIVIVEKKTAFNLVKKGFGEFEYVETIEFVRADREAAEKIAALEALVADLEADKLALMEALEQAIEQQETETEGTETEGTETEGTETEGTETEGDESEVKEPEPETPAENEPEEGK